jgi:PAS domain S-box-containing protein
MKRNVGDMPSFRGEIRFKCKDGTIKHVEVYDSVIKLKGKKAMVSVVQDVSIRKRAEEGWLETERRLTAFIKYFPGITFVKNTEGNYLYTNSQFEEMIRNKSARPGETNGNGHSERKYSNRLDRADKLVLAESKTVTKVERVVQKSGARYWLIYKFPIIGDNGIVNAIGGVGMDITERRNAELEVRESRKRLSALNANANIKAEEIAAHIGREIHDDLGQMLTSLKFDLAWLQNKMPEEQVILRNKTATMSELVDQTIKSVVHITSELRPRLLDDLGLIAAVRWYIDEFQQRTNIQCRLSIDFEEIYLERTLSTAIFRILQEALINIARHAKATSATVELKKSHNTIILGVTDNGIGITQEQVGSPDSFGLLGIKERASAMGGTVKIKGVPKKGTEIEVTLPNR